MSLNPEFRRNLWLQLSAQRLVAAPVVLGALFAALWLLGNDAGMVRNAALAAFYVIAVLWGARRAADAVAEEVNGGTWDGQRMSALGAWTMTWGKFAGGTAFIWYCAAIALAVALVAAGDPIDPIDDLARPIGAALIAQVVAMASSLMFLRKQAAGAKLSVTFSQLLGLAAALAVAGDVIRFFQPWPWGDSLWANWYGYVMPSQNVALASLAAFAAWGVVAMYRLMRAELQFRTSPWVWLLFVAFMGFYLEGFFYPSLVRLDARALWFLPPLASTVVLVYAAALLEPKDVVRYRWFVQAGGDWPRALSLTPLWLPTYLMAAALAFFAMPGERVPLPLLDELLPGRSILPSPSALIALLLFMARDMALILYLNFGGNRRRADTAAVVYLVLAYGPLPGIAYALGVPVLPSLFLPVDAGNPLFTVGPPLLQAAAMIVLLRRRWLA